MIIKDESDKEQFITKIFYDIPYGTVFKGQSGYISYSIFIKTDPFTAFDLKACRAMRIGTTDVISHYKEMEAYLVLNAKNKD